MARVAGVWCYRQSGFASLWRHAQVYRGQNMARVLGWPVCGAIDSLGGLSVLLWTVPPDPIKEGPSNITYRQCGRHT